MYDLNAFQNRLRVDQLPPDIAARALAAGDRVDGTIVDAGAAFASILREAYVLHEMRKAGGGGYNPFGQATPSLRNVGP